MMPKYMAFDKNGNDLNIVVYASTSKLALHLAQERNPRAYSVVKI